MDRFYKQVKDAKEVVQQAKGILIMPNVKKGALIVDGEYGKGAIRIGGWAVGGIPYASAGQTSSQGSLRGFPHTVLFTPSTPSALSSSSAS
jgi:lipid-binding SYLF domain-containing protein